MCKYGKVTTIFNLHPIFSPVSFSTICALLCHFILFFYGAPLFFFMHQLFSDWNQEGKFRPFLDGNPFHNDVLIEHQKGPIYARFYLFELNNAELYPFLL